jgi:hypothetical protein
MKRSLLVPVADLMAIAACGGAPSTDPGSAHPAPTTATTGGVPVTEPRADEILPRCYEGSLPSADPSFYRDTPKDVGNEMPVEAVRQWASQYPDFVDVWIDREHNGWVAAGFTDPVADRQAEIEDMFPEDGVVAVHLAWTEAGLNELQGRVAEELDGVVEVLGTSTDTIRGYVNVVIPVLSVENLNAIRDRFPDERICVEGLEPDDVVPAGPQPQDGDGWRLLVDADGVGDVYTTGIAWDEASLLTLVDGIPGLGEVDVDADFDDEVVIWFGAVHGSSCPNLRLDDVVVSGDTIHAMIVNTGNALVCTDDAIPHAYLVAVERSKLPAPTFYVSIGAESSIGRLMVGADLREPGSTAGPDQVGPDPNPPGSQPEGSGVIIETGFPWEYTVDLSCGFEAIGEINSFDWVAVEPIPDSWIETTAGAETVVVEVVLEEGPEPTVEVTFDGETVVYEPGTPQCREG